jgi:glutamyl-tRNA reductase
VQLILIGVNYKSAPLHAREQLSFHSREAQAILRELHEQEHVAETVLLSTCNRTEIYAIVHDTLKARERIVNVLAHHSQLPAHTLEPLLYTFYNKFAATHLFEVAAGLDSMVLGENEILRQVKSAQDIAKQASTSGPVLNQLLRYAIMAGKRVRTETDINKGCASIGALAARLVKEHFQNIAQPRLLILGAGQMAQVMVKNLDTQGAELFIANRTREKAMDLQALYGGQTHLLSPQEALKQAFDVDAVVVCTSAEHYLLQAHDFQAPLQKPLLLVDLSVPRNIDPALAQQDNIQLYDVDALQHKVDMSIEKRRMYIAQAQSIIGEETTRFLEWFNNRDVVPTIKALYQTFESIRERELERGTARYKEQMTPETTAMLEQVTRAMVQKILHHPVVRLKNASVHKQEQYHEALNTLFALDAQDEMDKFVYHQPAEPQSCPAHVLHNTPEVVHHDG